MSQVTTLTDQWRDFGKTVNNSDILCRKGTTDGLYWGKFRRRVLDIIRNATCAAKFGKEAYAFAYGDLTERLTTWVNDCKAYGGDGALDENVIDDDLASVLKENEDKVRHKY